LLEFVLCLGAFFIATHTIVDRAHDQLKLDPQRATCSELVASSDSRRSDYAADQLKRLRQRDSRGVRGDLVPAFAEAVRSACVSAATKPAKDVAADVYSGARDQYGAP
jgi:hypothetical protein